MSHHPRIRSKPPHGGDWRPFRPALALCSGLLLLVVYGFVRETIADRPPQSNVPVVVLGHDKVLHLDPTKLQPSQIHLFEADASGQKVKFIVERIQNNTIHVALASCRTCYRSRDRHYTRNGEMICSECNAPMAFEPKHSISGSRSCALVEIPHTETARDVAVLTRDVLAQAAKLPQ